MDNRVNICLVAALFALLSLACDKKAPSSRKGSGEEAGDPSMSEPADRDAPPAMPAQPDGMRPRITIRPTDPRNATGFRVETGGMSVWPPQGPGCDRLVACCRAGAALERSLGLFCQLAVARQPVDCGQTLAKVRQYLAERSLAAPGACDQR